MEWIHQLWLFLQKCFLGKFLNLKLLFINCFCCLFKPATFHASFKKSYFLRFFPNTCISTFEISKVNSAITVLSFGISGMSETDFKSQDYHSLVPRKWTPFLQSKSRPKHAYEFLFTRTGNFQTKWTNYTNKLILLQ